MNVLVKKTNSHQNLLCFRINAIREICARCSHAITPDLLQDIAEYNNYKNKSNFKFNFFATLTDYVFFYIV